MLYEARRVLDVFRERHAPEHLLEERRVAHELQRGLRPPQLLHDVVVLADEEFDGLGSLIQRRKVVGTAVITEQI